jgi:arylsulfatase A-like enzyme
VLESHVGWDYKQAAAACGALPNCHGFNILVTAANTTVYLVNTTKLFDVTVRSALPAGQSVTAYLKAAAGYAAHAVGKWHLGGNTVRATPTGRGFDSYVGYWCGAQDYETHSVSGAGGGMVYDFHNTSTGAGGGAAFDETLVDAYGTFSTRVFSAAATDIIARQGAAGAGAPPLFLYLAWQNVHWPLMAPAEYVARFANTTGGAGDDRNYVAAMMAFVDDAVGNVTAAVTAAGLDDNTIVVLVSDNGGPTNGDEGTASSNFPLRGGKNTLWEGGTRVIGMVRGPGVAVGVTSTAKVRATERAEMRALFARKSHSAVGRARGMV